MATPCVVCFAGFGPVATLGSNTEFFSAPAAPGAAHPPADPAEQPSAGEGERGCCCLLLTSGLGP